MPELAALRIGDFQSDDVIAREVFGAGIQTHAEFEVGARLHLLGHWLQFYALDPVRQHCVKLGNTWNNLCL